MNQSFTFDRNEKKNAEINRVTIIMVINLLFR